jgi:hypothetical protein
MMSAAVHDVRGAFTNLGCSQMKEPDSIAFVS